MVCCESIQRQIPENWQNYQQLRDETKKLGAEAKVKPWDNFGCQLEYNHHSANELFWQIIPRLYKGGQKSIGLVKNTSDRLLTRDEDILNRGRNTFQIYIIRRLDSTPNQVNLTPTYSTIYL